MVRYLIVGGISAVVDLSFFAILNLHIKFGIISSSIISFLVAITVNYFLGIWIVFHKKSRFNAIEQFFLVFLVSGSGLFFNIIFIYIFMLWFDLNSLEAKFLAIFPCFLWNYLARRVYIYKK